MSCKFCWCMILSSSMWNIWPQWMQSAETRSNNFLNYFRNEWKVWNWTIVFNTSGFQPMYEPLLSHTSGEHIYFPIHDAANQWISSVSCYYNYYSVCNFSNLWTTVPMMLHIHWNHIPLLNMHIVPSHLIKQRQIKRNYYYFYMELL